MREKKVVVSVRLPLWIINGVDDYSHFCRLRDRSKTILYAIRFFIEHFPPEKWELYYQAEPPQIKVAWDLFWSALRSPEAKSNTIDSYDSADRP